MSPLADKTVLFAEDDEADVELTRRAFAELGFDARLVTASNGKEALRRMDDGLVPDLVLTDLKMPLVNGLELARALRGDDRRKEIPVVILTSSSEVKDRDAAAALGVEAFEMKPMELEGYRPIVARLKALLGE
jgi:CheY-like chemotaxis protein